MLEIQMSKTPAAERASEQMRKTIGIFKPEAI
jgi:hypothetical protein